MTRTWTIIDLQFGSTGKGLLAGVLAKRWGATHAVTAWGPNAGHTFVHADGTAEVRTMLANATANRDLKRVMIGPGSVIDEAALLREMHEANWDLDRLMIHDHAVVVQDRHRIDEKAFIRIGSTMKGTARAMMERMERNSEDKILARDAMSTILSACLVSPTKFLKEISCAERLQVEGAQGFGLSLYHGDWPYVTSRDVSTYQTLADCGVPHGRDMEIIGCVRTFPIRVSNRIDAEGKVFTSGPGYLGQKETTFEAIGRPQEHTTVTKLPRRIFEWSDEQFAHAVLQNGVDKVFLNFANYLSEECMAAKLARIKSTIGARLLAVGNGPREDQVEFV